MIFPEESDKVKIIDGQTLIVPEDESRKITQTIDILNASANEKSANSVPASTVSDEEYYDSSNDSDISDSVEEVQADDKAPQKDNLEENYK